MHWGGTLCVEILGHHCGHFGGDDGPLFWDKLHSVRYCGWRCRNKDPALDPRHGERDMPAEDSKFLSGQVVFSQTRAHFFVGSQNETLDRIPKGSLQNTEFWMVKVVASSFESCSKYLQ